MYLGWAWIFLEKTKNKKEWNYLDSKCQRMMKFKLMKMIFKFKIIVKITILKDSLIIQSKIK